ncbi:MAG: UDP-N-acetylmuramate dehydrogenase [Firmicutes bacterium]|nr:UDP-N-acetylmuramate dehydrogenase [Bacillota bacterium]
MQDLRSVVSGTIKANESMQNHTSWKIGGPAEVFVEPQSLKDLQSIFIYARENGIDLTVIGHGSNLLVSDLGVKGIVVKIGRGMDYFSVQGNRITAGAGVKLARLAALARENALEGFEFAAGIPGTVGGALAMNAGANNWCMADLVSEVLTIDNSGNIRKYMASELDFSYRSSELREKSLTVVEAVFEGVKGNRETIKKVTEDNLGKRKKTQPLNYPNAGSVFKNPPGDSAGRLIEMVGAKGLAVGDAQVSTKHANFFINRKRATARDMLILIKKVQSLVWKEYGINLCLEVQLVGEH